MRDLTVRYRPELDPVLKRLSFSVRPAEKIGVAGRTGCGKSTLMITLYRLIEPCGGTMVIDGVDITKIGLRDLRSRLSLVPQVGVIGLIRLQNTNHTCSQHFQMLASLCCKDTNGC